MRSYFQSCDCLYRRPVPSFCDFVQAAQCLKKLCFRLATCLVAPKFLTKMLNKSKMGAPWKRDSPDVCDLVQGYRRSSFQLAFKGTSNKATMFWFPILRQTHLQAFSMRQKTVGFESELKSGKEARGQPEVRPSDFPSAEVELGISFNQT